MPGPGHVKAHAVSCQSLTKKDPVQSQASAQGISGEQTGAETGLSAKTMIVLCQYHSMNMPYSFINLSLSICILSN